jgi:urocanate hydratase
MDLNVHAFRVVQQATDETTSLTLAKRKASRKGGLRGGPARVASISADERRRIALKANEARWAKQRQGIESKE